MQAFVSHGRLLSSLLQQPYHKFHTENILKRCSEMLTIKILLFYHLKYELGIEKYFRKSSVPLLFTNKIRSKHFCENESIAIRCHRSTLNTSKPNKIKVNQTKTIHIHTHTCGGILSNATIVSNLSELQHLKCAFSLSLSTCWNYIGRFSLNNRLSNSVKCNNFCFIGNTKVKWNRLIKKAHNSSLGMCEVFFCPFISVKKSVSLCHWIRSRSSYCPFELIVFIRLFHILNRLLGHLDFIRSQ